MQAIHRIVVTGDVLRQRETGGSSQIENIQWLYHLVSPAIRLISDLPVSMLQFTGDKKCLGTRLFDAHHVPASFESWASLLHKKPAPRDLAFVHDEFDGALVVAFELAEILREALDILQIPYIDFTVHPVRFLDDLLLGVRSNIPDIAVLMRPYAVSGADIEIGLGIVQATLAKRPRLAEVKGDNVALFAAQTTDDKVLIRNGRFPVPEDFMAQFEGICAAHDVVLVKPHPYVRNNPVITALTRLFPNTRTTLSNFYQLIAHEGVTHCYSLTSSASLEARYFGKHGVHLAPYPYVFVEDSPGKGEYLSIHPDLFLPGFWQTVFSPLGVETRPSPTVRLIPQRSRMRRSLNNFWGADIFEQVA